MTLAQRNDFQEGYFMYMELSRMNKEIGKPDSLRVTNDDIARLSRRLDLNQSYVRRCIDTYLWE